MDIENFQAFQMKTTLFEYVYAFGKNYFGLQNSSKKMQKINSN